MAKSIATFDLVQDAGKALSRTRRDTFDQATRYRANLNAPNTHPAYVAGQVRVYGAAVVTTLDRISALSAAIEAACTEWDIDHAALVVSYNQIRQAAVAMRDAAVDGSNVQARLDAIIAGLTRGTVL